MLAHMCNTSTWEAKVGVQHCGWQRGSLGLAGSQLSPRFSKRVTQEDNTVIEQDVVFLLPLHPCTRAPTHPYTRTHIPRAYTACARMHTHTHIKAFINKGIATTTPRCAQQPKGRQLSVVLKPSLFLVLVAYLEVRQARPHTFYGPGI